MMTGGRIRLRPGVIRLDDGVTKGGYSGIAMMRRLNSATVWIWLAASSYEARPRVACGTLAATLSISPLWRRLRIHPFHPFNSTFSCPRGTGGRDEHGRFRRGVSCRLEAAAVLFAVSGGPIRRTAQSMATDKPPGPIASR